MSKRVGAGLCIALVILAAAFWFWRLSPPASKPTVATAAKAFQNAEWGSSPAEVERANGVTLNISASPKRYYTVKSGVDAARYQSLESPEVDFLGRKARVTYVFFDNRLFSYAVFVEDEDAEALDAEMRDYLVHAFGEGYTSMEEDGAPLRLIWHSRATIVNYWLTETFSLRPKASAGFGVVDNALEATIKP